MNPERVNPTHPVVAFELDTLNNAVEMSDYRMFFNPLCERTSKYLNPKNEICTLSLEVNGSAPLNHSLNISLDIIEDLPQAIQFAQERINHANEGYTAYVMKQNEKEAKREAERLAAISFLKKIDQHLRTEANPALKDENGNIIVTVADCQ